MGVKFEVTTHPEFTTEQLAVQLAESIQSAFDAQADADLYTEQLKAEKKKTLDLKSVLLEVDEFKKNPPKKVSRMDPIASYNREDLVKQITLSEDMVNKLIKLQEESLQKAKNYRQKTSKLQKEISERNANKG